MKEIWAFIINLTPLTQGNDKSCINILYELIPNISDFKSIQDTLVEDINTERDNFKEKIKTFTEKIDENIQNINEKIEKDKENFNLKKSEYLNQLSSLILSEDNKMSEFSTNFSNDLANFKNTIESDKTNLINLIDSNYNEIIVKINDYMNDYFSKNPDKFNEGIEKVNFDKTIQYTSTNRWQLRLNSYNIIVKVNSDKQKTKYWYNKDEKMIYYNDHVSNDTVYNKAGQLYRYDNHILFTDLEFSLGDELFPHTENGYFIGFIKRVAYYFAETNNENETKYDIKAIDLDTKEITIYENLVMPSTFKNVYLQSNSHYIINKCKDTYYILYSVEGEVRPYLAKSSDLIHWANIGRINSSGESALKVINDNLYYVSLIQGSWIFNEDENNLTKILDNGKNIIVNGEYLGLYSAFSYNGYRMIFTDDNKFTNILHQKSANQPTGLTNALIKGTAGINYYGVFLGSAFYTLKGMDYSPITYLSRPNVLLFDQLNNAHLLMLEYNFTFDENQKPSTFGNNNIIFPTNINQYGDYVITEDMEVYSDFNLQKLSCKVETRSINT